MNRATEKLYRLGKIAPEVFMILMGSMSRSGVFKAVKQLEETGTAQQRLLSTTKRPIRTEKLIKKPEKKCK